MNAKRTVVLVLLVAVLTAATIGVVYLFRSGLWLLGIVPAIVVGLLWLALLAQRKQNLTPRELAVKLEGHLHNTEGTWDWDDTTSIRAADPKLTSLIGKLPKFDVLASEERRKEFVDLIDELKRGEIPDVEPE